MTKILLVGEVSPSNSEKVGLSEIKWESYHNLGQNHTKLKSYMPLPYISLVGLSNFSGGFRY